MVTGSRGSETLEFLKRKGEAEHELSREELELRRKEIAQMQHQNVTRLNAEMQENGQILFINIINSETINM